MDRASIAWQRVVAAAAAVTLLAATHVAAEEATTSLVWPYAVGVGDLDGDGAGDVVDYSATVATPEQDEPLDAVDYVLTARQGRSGTRLWSLQFDDRPTVRPVSLEGHPGLVVVEVGENMASGGGGTVPGGPNQAEQYGVRALTFHGVRADGSLAWSRALETGAIARVYPTGTADVAAAAYHQLPLDVGTLRRAGAADAVVVGQLDRTELAGQVRSSARIQLLDAADGSVVAETARSAEGARPVPRAAGDLDGDGYQDVLVTAPGTGAAGVTALSGKDLSELWHNAGVDVPAFASTSDAGDVTGDGVGDVLVFGDDRAVVNTSAGFTDPFTAILLDGRTGEQLFRQPAHAAFPAGDAGGGAEGEVGIVTALRVGNAALVLVNHVDARGRDVVTADFAVPDEGASVDLRGPVGDLNGDGVVETAHTLRSGSHDDSAVVDGRTGRRLREELPGRPLGPLTGGGPARLSRISSSDGSAVLELVDGISGDAIWRAELPAPQAGPAWLHELTADGVRDVIVAITTAGGIDTIAAVDGGTGRVLWVR